MDLRSQYTPHEVTIAVPFAAVHMDGEDRP